MVISTVSPAIFAPMVPNARPMSQCASAIGFTIARISSGVASVVKSRSLVPRPRNASRTGPPTRASSCPFDSNAAASVATVGEAASSPSRSRAAATLCMPPMLAERARRRPPRCGRRADAPSPRRRIACMVAESNPARRRADSSTRRPADVVSDSVLAGVALARARRCGRGAARRERGRRPGRGLQAVSGAAGGPAAVGCRERHVPRRVRRRPSTTRTPACECGSRRRSPPPSPSGRPWPSRSRSRTRPAEALAAGRRAPRALDGSRSTTRPPSTTGSSPTSREPTGISSSNVPLAESESRSLAAGGATVVSFTVPGEAFADARRVARRRPRRGTPSSTTPWSPRGTSAYANADVPASGSVAVALAAPLTAPTTVGAVGLIAADQLENWTGPTGLLTASSTRSPGGGWRSASTRASSPRSACSARARRRPPSQWLQRLADVPNEVFPLAYADADLAVQAQLELPALLTPTSFSDVLDPANFTAGAAATPTRATEPAAPRHRRADRARADARARCRPPSELLEWPYTRTDLAWPADDTVAAGDLGYFDAAGLTTALLAPGNVEPVDGRRRRPRRSTARPRSSPTAGSPAPLRAASEASTDTEWRAGDGRAARRTRDRRRSRRARPMLATFDRGAHAKTDRVADTIDEIGGSGWSSLAGLSDAIGAPPGRPRRSSTSPRPTSGAPWPERMVAVEAEVTEFATVLADRAAAHRADAARACCRCSTWPGSTTATPGTPRSPTGSLTAARRARPASRSCRAAPSTGRRPETAVPTTIENALPFPVTVSSPSIPVQRPAHRRGQGRGQTVGAAVALHRARAGRRRRRQRRGHARGFAVLAHRACRSATPVRSPRTCRPTGRASAPRSSRDRGPRSSASASGATSAVAAGSAPRRRRDAGATDRRRRRRDRGDADDPRRPDRAPMLAGAADSEAPAPEASGAPTSPARRAPSRGMTTRIGRASAFLASGTIVSRILGFVKAIIVAATIGVVGSAGADAFAVANALPNTVYVIVAGGVLERGARAADRARRRPRRRRQRLHQQAAHRRARHPRGARRSSRPRWRRCSRSLYGATLPQATLDLAIAFAWWCLPQIFFYGLYTLLGEVLNARRSFGPFTWVPVLNNVVAIAGLLVFAYAVRRRPRRRPRGRRVDPRDDRGARRDRRPSASPRRRSCCSGSGGASACATAPTSPGAASGSAPPAAWPAGRSACCCSPRSPASCRRRCSARRRARTPRSRRSTTRGSSSCCRTR